MGKDLKLLDTLILRLFELVLQNRPKKTACKLEETF